MAWEGGWPWGQVTTWWAWVFWPTPFSPGLCSDHQGLHCVATNATKLRCEVGTQGAKLWPGHQTPFVTTLGQLGLYALQSLGGAVACLKGLRPKWARVAVLRTGTRPLTWPKANQPNL